MTAMPEQQSLAPASLSSAFRTGFAVYFESFGRFLAAGVAWALVLGVLLYLLRASIFIVLTPLLAPVTCGLGALAAAAMRGRPVTVAAARAGVAERFWTKVALGAAQIAVLIVTVANISVAPSLGGLLGSASAVLSVYLAASVTAYGLATWPLLCDPARAAQRTRPLLTLGLAVLVRRLAQWALLLVVVVAGGYLTVLYLAPVLFLPALAIAIVTAYALSAADEIDQPGSGETVGETVDETDMDDAGG